MTLTTMAFSSVTAIRAGDVAVGGRCAEGVRRALTGAGFQEGPDFTRGHAFQWRDMLQNHNDWVFIQGSPETAPEGAILTYDHDHPRPSSGDDGHRWGHVEIVTVNEQTGARQYTSDAPRNNWGGSVPGNYSGGYFVHTSMYTPAQIAALQGGAGDVVPGRRMRTPSPGDPEYLAAAGAGDRSTGSFAGEMDGGRDLMQDLMLVIGVMGALCSMFQGQTGPEEGTTFDADGTPRGPDGEPLVAPDVAARDGESDPATDTDAPAADAPAADEATVLADAGTIGGARPGVSTPGMT